MSYIRKQDPWRGQKIFGVGLPRSAGQTLSAVLSGLTKKTFWHSPVRKWDMIDDSSGGAAEVFSPIPALEEMFPGSYYVMNCRRLEPWLASCESHYSQSKDWSHPLWRLPLEHFGHYYQEYRTEKFRQLDSLPSYRVLYWDITDDPDFHPICKFLSLPIPEVEFPTRDRFQIEK